MLKAGEQVPNLNEHRIAELEAMGFVWKIRHGRPKKGKKRFRLRRKNQDSSSADDDDDYKYNEAVGQQVSADV